MNNDCATHQDVSTTQQGVTLSKMTVLFKIIFLKPSIHTGCSLFCDSGPDFGHPLASYRTTGEGLVLDLRGGSSPTHSRAPGFH